ncbi:MAG: hypothetical protein Q8O40_14605 [Chloroflexota bacterium]|nr:hypothetical protein [Chloroflexota bacterium]
MTLPLRPGRGGFLRPFGCGLFIRDFLLGNGPQGSSRIDPNEGAPQVDIRAAYKEALYHAFAQDQAEWDISDRVRRGETVTEEQARQIQEYYFSRIPYKITKCRYHSFITYFGLLKRLGWVEPTNRPLLNHRSFGLPRPASVWRTLPLWVC